MNGTTGFHKTIIESAKLVLENKTSSHVGAARILAEHVVKREETISYVIDRMKRRIAENKTTAAIHPDERARRDAEARVGAYACALYDLEQAFEDKNR